MEKQVLRVKADRKPGRVLISAIAYTGREMTPVEVYRIARKRHDQIWNVFVARPLAAPIVSLLLPTRVTPNQLTFLNLFLFVVAAGALAWIPGQKGTLLGVLVLELSYVFDCADGMLARTKKLASPVGHLLDFMTDELKAFLLVGAMSIHLFRTNGDERMLLLGVLGLVVVASALALTTFVRRPEYTGMATTTEAHYETAGAMSPPRSLGKAAALALLTFLRFLNHYPSHIWIWALLDRMKEFLVMYLVLNLLYLAQTSLSVLVRLGRPLPKGAP
jgi:phosphatidylglycerophosphate synthase